MKKRILSMVLTLALAVSTMIGTMPMTAAADTMMVVTVGADLTEEQKNMILRYFNVAGQSYTTITVTNDDEWSHLGGYMSRDIVGYRTISCALIRPMTSGGIQVKTANLTYVTSNMIASNLATAGVTNCEVLAAAPFQVSGTGALTGALMAYENLSGVTLDAAKKQAAVQEFATTYELGKTIGQQEAQQIVNDVKMQVINGTLEQDNSVTNEEITEIVNNVVNNYTTNNTTNTTNNTTYNNGLTEADIAALQQLAVQISKESYEQGTLDALAQIQKTLEGQTQTASTAATSEIVDNASSTADSAQTAASTDSGQQASAADQALAEDSLLNNTDESALASTTDNGSVITSATAESTIDTSVSTNLDTQIEEQQGTTDQTQASSTDVIGIPEPTDSTTIPAPTDSTVIPDASADQTVVEQPAPVEEQPVTVEEPAAVDQPVVEEPVTVDQPVVEEPAAVDQPVVEEPAAVDQPVVEEPAEVEQPVVEEPQIAMVRDTAITADDVRSGNAQLISYATTGDGSAQASGNAPVALVLPYNDLVPVSGTLHIMDSSGVEVGMLDLAGAPSGRILTVHYDPTASVPGGWEGYTKILMIADDLYNGGTFSPAAGENYTYTLDAQFAQTADPAAIDGAPVLNVAIDNYRPYGGMVSETGLVVESYDLADPNFMYGAQGAVKFPSDGSAAYAVVTADMASVGTASGAAGITAGSEDRVLISPVQGGKVTLTITYYGAAPEEGMEPDPAAVVATASCSVQFTG